MASVRSAGIIVIAYNSSVKATIILRAAIRSASIIVIAWNRSVGATYTSDALIGSAEQAIVTGIEVRDASFIRIALILNGAWIIIKYAIDGLTQTAARWGASFLHGALITIIATNRCIHTAVCGFIAAVCGAEIAIVACTNRMETSLDGIAHVYAAELTVITGIDVLATIGCAGITGAWIVIIACIYK